MKIIEVEWDDTNSDHIAFHRVRPSEVDDVCFGNPFVVRKEKGNRYILAGRSSAGRYLMVVVEQIGGGKVRPITAYDMDENQKRGYKRRVGG